jgi:hypothetical protein
MHHTRLLDATVGHLHLPLPFMLTAVVPAVYSLLSDINVVHEISVLPSE